MLKLRLLNDEQETTEIRRRDVLDIQKAIRELHVVPLWTGWSSSKKGPWTKFLAQSCFVLSDEFEWGLFWYDKPGAKKEILLIPMLKA